MHAFNLGAGRYDRFAVDVDVDVVDGAEAVASVAVA